MSKDKTHERRMFIITALSQRSMNRSEITKKGWTYIETNKDFDEILKQFVEHGIVEVVLTEDEIRYRLTPDTVMILKKYFKKSE